MYPHERSLVKKHKGKPFAIIGVNSDFDRDLLKAVVKKKNLSWRSFWAGPGGGWGAIPKRWGVRTWPKVYLIDHKGVIRYQDLKGDKMDEAIDKLLAEASAELPKGAQTGGVPGKREPSSDK